jgi:hypothetical protein
MVLLLVAVQVIVDLYARSAVTAATFDAARQVAGFDVTSASPSDQQAARVGAEAEARRLLGRSGQAARFNWTVTADEVDVRVRIAVPSIVPLGLRRPLGIDSIDRTVRVRAEHLVCPRRPACHLVPAP